LLFCCGSRNSETTFSPATAGTANAGCQGVSPTASNPAPRWDADSRASSGLPNRERSTTSQKRWPEASTRWPIGPTQVFVRGCAAVDDCVCECGERDERHASGQAGRGGDTDEQRMEFGTVDLCRLLRGICGCRRGLAERGFAIPWSGSRLHVVVLKTGDYTLKITKIDSMPTQAPIISLQTTKSGTGGLTCLSAKGMLGFRKLLLIQRRRISIGWI